MYDALSSCVPKKKTAYKRNKPGVKYILWSKHIEVVVQPIAITVV